MSDFAEAIDNTHFMNSVVSIENFKGENRYSSLIAELIRMGRLRSIKQAALITRDGLLIKGAPDNTYTGIFAAMIAATLGAAETAFAEIQMGKPDMLVLFMKGEKIIVKGAGPKMLLTAIIDDEVDDNIVLPMLEKTAQIIKSMS